MRLIFTRKFPIAALALALLVAPLTACDEAHYESAFTPETAPAAAGATEEPAPAPLEALPDLTLPDEWPAAYLPENFPVFPYSAIQDVRRENGEIKMTVTTSLAKMTVDGMEYSPFLAFHFMLRNVGYVNYPIPLAEILNGELRRECYFNQEGTVCDMLDTRNRGPNKEVIWEITVKFNQTFDFNISPYFMDWPPLDTDLGLEELVFDKWPAEYLPDGFPEPIGMTPVSMVQLKNGVFLTFAGEMGDYDSRIEDMGYKQYHTEGFGHPNYYKNPFLNSNNDRYYYIYSQAEVDAITDALQGLVSGTETETENNAAGRKTVIQVIKGEDTERYWQSQGGQ